MEWRGWEAAKCYQNSPMAADHCQMEGEHAHQHVVTHLHVAKYVYVANHVYVATHLYVATHCTHVCRYCV